MAPVMIKKPATGTKASTRQCKAPKRYADEAESSLRVSKPKPRGKTAKGPVKLTAEEEKKLQCRSLKKDFPQIAEESKTVKTAAKTSLPSPDPSDDGSPGRAPSGEPPKKKIRLVLKKRDQGTGEHLSPNTQEVHSNENQVRIQEPQCISKSCSVCIKHREICVEDGVPNCDCTDCAACPCKDCEDFRRRMEHQTELDRLWKEEGPTSEAYRKQALEIMEERMKSEAWLREACERKARREGGIWRHAEMEAAQALIMMSRS